VYHRADEDKALRTLNLIDDLTRECLEIRVKRKLNSTNVIDLLTDLFILRGIPTYIRSDNGPEFVAQAVRDWIKAVGGHCGDQQILCHLGVQDLFSPTSFFNEREMVFVTARL
jgi:transposase InsO family protein